MSSTLSMNVKGMDEIAEAFDKVRDSVKTREVNKVLKRAARPIRKVARSMAPVGPTGNLRRSIKTKTLKKGAVAVRSDFRMAPHAHLVLRGTGERFRKRAVIRVGPLGISLRGASTGVMPANAFMERAEKATRSQAERLMANGLWELIKRASR